MLFSTKAEYGVRLMVALGPPARASARSPLAALADAETPAALLPRAPGREAARRRPRQLQRGAHGGYRLARPAEEIRMLEVVEALEGPIAPMECFHRRRARAASSARTRPTATSACSTKLLWTRVHGGITRALAGTTLAELVEFESRDGAEHRRRPRRLSAPDTEPTTELEIELADLEIKNLHVSAEDKQILKGLDLEVGGARSTR